MARAVRLPFPVPRESGLDPVGHIRIRTGIFASVLFLCGPGAISCSGLAGPDAGREAPLCHQPRCWKQKHIGSLLTSPFLTSGVRSSFPVAQPHSTTTLHLASSTSVLRYGLRQLLGLFHGALSWTRRPWRSRAMGWGSEKEEGETLHVSTEGRETGGERESGMEEGGGHGTQCIRGQVGVGWE